LKLIITADDYGMSIGVNEAIKEGIKAGIITSTNVMTNMEYYMDVKELKQYNPSVSIGIHWTLTAGKPVTEVGAIPSLVDSNGCFYSYSEFHKRYRQRMIKDDEIVKELKGQYDLFNSVYGAPDYWNTHQNVHVDFHIYRLFVNTAKELNIYKMRSHQRVYVPSSTKESSMPLSWRIIEPLKSKLIDSWQKNAHQLGIESPDGIIVCLNEKDNGNPEYVFSNIQWGKKTCAEYVIHPATQNDSPFFGKIVEQRIREYKFFSDPSLLKIFESNNIILVNY